MKHLGKTPPFPGAKGETLPDSIAEIGYLRLGELDQWVMIRGESLANPALIFLHGGPGFTEMRLFRHFNAPLEKSFTVVNWDQRGSGKSFDRKIPKSSMTVEEFIADLDELVDAVRERLRQDKVTIFGHSWGSALGVLYAARFPEKVAAYVGSGQIGNWLAGELSSYAYVLAEADDATTATPQNSFAPSARRPIPRRDCGCSASGSAASRADQADCPCGSSAGLFSVGRNRLFSIYPTSGAAFSSLWTLCGRKYQR